MDNRLMHTSMCSVCCIAQNILDCLDCITVRLSILPLIIYPNTLGYQGVGHGHVHHRVLLHKIQFYYLLIMIYYTWMIIIVVTVTTGRKAVATLHHYISLTKTTSL